MSAAKPEDKSAGVWGFGRKAIPEGRCGGIRKCGGNENRGWEDG